MLLLVMMTNFGVNLTGLRNVKIISGWVCRDFSRRHFNFHLQTESRRPPSPLQGGHPIHRRPEQNKKVERGQIFTFCLSWDICLPIPTDISSPVLRLSASDRATLSVSRFSGHATRNELHHQLSLFSSLKTPAQETSQPL